MKLIIGNQNYSSWSMRPWLFIQYHNIDVEIEKLALFEPETVALLKQHFSDGKVPLLLDGDLEIWDTISILEYLAEKFPHLNGWPEHQAARAVARSVAAEMHSSFSSLRNEIPMNCRRYFPDYKISDATKRDIIRIRTIWNACRQDYAVDGPWLFGSFSIADAMYAPVVMRFRSVDVELDDVSKAYCETMHGCDAVVQWITQGKSEKHVVEEDELDWPSVEIG